MQSLKFQLVEKLKHIGMDGHIVSGKGEVFDLIVKPSQRMTDKYHTEVMISQWILTYVENSTWFATISIGMRSVPIAFHDNPFSLIDIVNDVYKSLRKADYLSKLKLISYLDTYKFAIRFIHENHFHVYQYPSVKQGNIGIENYSQYVSNFDSLQKWEVTFDQKGWKIETQGELKQVADFDEINTFFKLMG